MNNHQTCPSTRISTTPKRASRWSLVALVVVMVATSMPVTAAHVNATSGMTLAGAPLAIHGYDPVAYFKDGRARIGKADHTATHREVAYRFVTAANKQAFERSPNRYLPQYGGYCAFGVSVGAKFDGDPTLFRVVNGKLYFNLNPDIQTTWQKDIPGNITKADRNWPGIQEKDPSELK